MELAARILGWLIATFMAAASFGLVRELLGDAYGWLTLRESSAGADAPTGTSGGAWAVSGSGSAETACGAAACGAGAGRRPNRRGLPGRPWPWSWLGWWPLSGLGPGAAPGAGVIALAV
jgi:hypothetical protein